VVILGAYVIFLFWRVFYEDVICVAVCRCSFFYE
ncbi:MAG: hypothetical protein RIS47_316, partial [Bacteroidota bacterium]